MKNLIITYLLLGFTLTCFAQTSEVKYYKSRVVEGVEEVPQSKAKYSKTTTMSADGVVTTEIKNIKKNLVEVRYAWKGEEPFGSWIILRGSGPAELDYNFALEYSEKLCESSPLTKQYVIDDPTIGYVAPKLANDMPYTQFIARELIYPATARRGNIQGKVEVSFDLTKEGVIENIRVTKGAHIVLDKEAVRLFRKLKFVSPAKINGEPQAMCVNTYLMFKLES